MILKLQITTNVKGDVFELVLKKSKYRVGRRFDNDLRIKESYVSAYHAEIHKDKDENYTLIDKNSSNGTFVNGNRVKGPEAVPIHEGDYIKFGMLKVKVASYVDTGPKVVGLGERDSSPKAVASTQPMKRTTPVPPAPKPGSAVSDKTGPFPSAAKLAPSTSKVATVIDSSEKEDDLAALSLKLSAVEKERDEFRKKAELLEKQSRVKQDKAKAAPKKQAAPPANTATELALLEKEFASKERYLTEEISKLKRDLEAAEKNAAKIELAEESKEKSEQLIGDLQKQIAEFKKTQEKAKRDFQKLSRKSELLEKNLESEKEEKEKLSSTLDEKIADAEAAKSLASKLEKNQLHSSEEGEKEVGKVRKQLSRLESQLEKESSARKKAELDLRERASELKLAGKERTAIEKEFKQQIKQLELAVKSEQAKVESASSDGKVSAAEIAGLKEKLTDIQSRLHDVETENSVLQKEKAESQATIESKNEAVKLADSRIAALESDLENQREDATLLSRRLEEKESILSGHEQNLATQTALAKAAAEREEESKKAILELEKSLNTVRGELDLVVKEKTGESEAAAILSGKLAALETERDSFQEEIKSLKNDLNVAGREAVEKAQLIEESKEKAEETITALQSRIGDLEREQELAVENGEKAVRESELLLASLGEERTEKEKQNTELEAKLHSIEEELRKEKEGRETESAALNSALVDQESRYQQLQKLLKDTQEGLSAVLRNAWNQQEEQKSLFQSSENLKLSESEEALSKAIHGREELLLVREKLEKQLVARERQEEKLREKIEELESRLSDKHRANEEFASQVESIQGELSAARKKHLDELEKLESRIQIEQGEQAKAAKEVEDANERCSQISQAADATKSELEREIAEWEKKYKRLKAQKASLTKEAETLSEIEEAISRASNRRDQCNAELADLNEEAKKIIKANADLEKEHEALLGKNTELDTGLRVARAELENVEKRCRETRSQEEKFTLRIGAAEKRVAALKHLETELEQAIDHKRKSKSKGLKRKKVFPSLPGESVAETDSNGATTEEVFCRKLISKLDLLDDLTIRYGSKWRYPKVSEQLIILKGSFLDLLREHSVDQFQMKPGAVLSLEERKRIKLIRNTDEKLKKTVINGNDDGQPRVIDTLRPGYVYQNGATSVIIRKAEVVVS